MDAHGRRFICGSNHREEVPADLALSVLLHLQLKLLHLLGRQPLQRQLRRRLVCQLPRQDHLHLCQALSKLLLAGRMLHKRSSMRAYLSW